MVVVVVPVVGNGYLPTRHCCFLTISILVSNNSKKTKKLTYLCRGIHRSELVEVVWHCIVVSAVPARLGLEAPALAWPEGASASSDLRPGQSRQPRLGSGLAWPGPRLSI